MCRVHCPIRHACWKWLGLVFNLLLLLLLCWTLALLWQASIVELPTDWRMRESLAHSILFCIQRMKWGNTSAWQSKMPYLQNPINAIFFGFSLAELMTTLGFLTFEITSNSSFPLQLDISLTCGACNETVTVFIATSMQTFCSLNSQVVKTIKQVFQYNTILFLPKVTMGLWKEIFVMMLLLTKRG